MGQLNSCIFTSNPPDWTHGVLRILRKLLYHLIKSCLLILGQPTQLACECKDMISEILLKGVLKSCVGLHLLDMSLAVDGGRMLEHGLEVL